MKNIFYSLLLFIACLVYPSIIFSQNDAFMCGTDVLQKYLMEHDSVYAAKINAINDYWKQSQRNNNSRISSDSVVTIPVVVHLIHTNNANGITDNLTDAQILDKITELNKTYSATNINYPNVSNGGVDTKIQFALAKRTPSCGSTNGILRVYAGNLPQYVAKGVRMSTIDSGCGITTAELQALSPVWPEDYYYNLYLVRNICDGPVGFASFGGYAVCLANGSVPTLVHETGHFLYLYHTFEGQDDSICASNSDCANMGDLVCDTDPLNYSGYGACAASDINPCTGRPYGNVANNFLSYGNCRNKLTQGQKIRMRTILEGPNQSLIYSLGAQPPAIVVPSLTIAQYAGTNPSCADSAIKFKATYSNNVGYRPQLTWYINSTAYYGSSDTLVFSGSSFNIRDNDTVYCSLTSTNQCMSPNPKYSNKIVVHRYPRVTPDVSIALFNSYALSCENSPLTFKATATYGGTNPVYQWRINNTNVGTNAPTFSSSAIQNNDHVTCILTSNENCTSKTKDTSNSITINRLIYATPAVSISLTSNNGSNRICQGTNLSFFATASNCFLVPVYQWKINGINTGTNAPSFSSSVLNNNDIVSCEITSKDSCVTVRQVTSNTIKIQVLPKVIPALSIQNLTNNDSTCAGDIVKLKAIPTNGGPNPTYQWLLTYNSTKDTITDVVAIGSKTYYCAMQIDTSKYCANNPVVSASRKILGEIKPAKPYITLITNYLKSNAVNGNQWYAVGTGKINGAVNQTYTPTANGKYYTIVTKNRCSSLPSDTININNITTGILYNKNENELAFHIVPNPTSGSFRILMQDKINGNVTVYVYDVMGQQVYNNTFNHLHEKEINIQLPALANGLYNVVIQKEDSSYSGKVEIIK